MKPSPKQVQGIIEVMTAFARLIFKQEKQLKQFNGKNFLPISSLNLDTASIPDLPPGKNRPPGSLKDELINSGYALLKDDVVLISLFIDNELAEPMMFYKRLLPDRKHDVIFMFARFEKIWKKYPPVNFEISKEFEAYITK